MSFGYLFSLWWMLGFLGVCRQYLDLDQDEDEKLYLYADLNMVACILILVPMILGPLTWIPTRKDG